MARKQSIMQAEPNVTPFLDVLLVLLIIFMYISLNQRKVITAELPDPAVDVRPDPPLPIVLEVLPNGSYSINAKAVPGPRLAARLRAIYEGRPTKTIIVRGSKGVRYQEVVTAIDIAKGAGVVAIGLK